jgi:hypothetical protein
MMAANARSHAPFLIAACLLLLAGALVRSAGAASLQGVSITSSSTAIKPGQIVTLTASWSGGVVPYTVRWYSGTNQMCQYDTNLIQTDTGISNDQDLLSVYPPAGGSYYCASVTDSSSPLVAVTSQSVGVTSGIASSTTTTSVPVTSPSSTTTTIPPAGAAAIVVQLCNIVNEVRSIIGIIALVLFMLGGLMYAISHFLPTNLEFKKSMTTWSTAMIIGGIIGLVVILIAQPVIVLIMGLGQSVGGASLPVVTC